MRAVRRSRCRGYRNATVVAPGTTRSNPLTAALSCVVSSWAVVTVVSGMRPRGDVPARAEPRGAGHRSSTRNAFLTFELGTISPILVGGTVSSRACLRTAGDMIFTGGRAG